MINKNIEKINNINYYSFEGYSFGKIIISGEHSVVYKKPGLSLSINKQTKIKITINKTINENNIFISINLLDINTKITILKNELISLLLNNNIKINNIKEHFISNILKVFSFIKKIDLIKYFINNYKISININSEIPLGFGLGSSAAYNSCIIKGFSHILLKYFNIKLEKNQIIKLSNEGEKYFHNGIPSGIDVTTSIEGGIIYFKNINEYDIICNNNIDNNIYNKLCIYLINSKIKRDGGNFIKKVNNFKNNNNNKFLNIINKIAQITEEIYNLSFSQNNNNNNNKFFELININQLLLKELFVSNEEIDKIIKILNEENFCGKITGAGGGGFILTLFEPEKENKFIEIMKKNNFEYLKIKPNYQMSFIKEIKEIKL